jgi:hypothetical protein
MTFMTPFVFEIPERSGGPSCAFYLSWFECGVDATQPRPHRGCGMRAKPEMDESGKLGRKKLLAEFERPRQL